MTTWVYWRANGRAATKMVSILLSGAVVRTSLTLGFHPTAGPYATDSVGSLHLYSAQVLQRVGTQEYNIHAKI